MRANYYFVFIICLLIWTIGTSQVQKEPLLEALKHHNIDLLGSIIAEGGNINGIYHSDLREKTTPICYAACMGNINMVKFLLEQGAQITIKEGYKYDALTKSIQCGQSETVDWFLTEGLYSSTSEDELKSYLYLSIENDDVATFNALLNKVPSAQTPIAYTDFMFSAAMNSKINLFQHLVGLGADIFAANEKGGGSEGESVMHVAASSQPILAFLIDKGFDPNTEAPNGQTPLHLCQNGDAAQFLLSQGAVLEAEDKFGWHPLHYAIFDGDVNVVDVLLNAGADKMAETKKKFETIYPDLTIKKGTSCLDLINQIGDYHSQNEEKKQAYAQIKTMIGA